MPKLKTHKATAKRFKFTGSGKIKRRIARASHLRRRRSKRVRRKFKTYVDVAACDTKRIRRLTGR
jgi:large subunit ribosomal protein L35